MKAQQVFFLLLGGAVWRAQAGRVLVGAKRSGSLHLQDGTPKYELVLVEMVVVVVVVVGGVCSAFCWEEAPPAGALTGLGEKALNQEPPHACARAAAARRRGRGHGLRWVSDR
ncbi:hypothetical protein AOLI_G00051070 [Acnodon oligacanthus]